MTDRIMALVAFLFLLGFLAVLVIGVPHIDLIVVVLITLLLAGWDFWKHSGKPDTRM